MKATSHCGFTRGGTQLLERQALCTRGVTGRQRRDRTGACVLTSSNPGTSSGITPNLMRQWTAPPLVLKQWSERAPCGPFFSFFCVNMRMCMFRTLSDYTVPPNVHSVGVPWVVLFDTILKQQWDHVWMRDNRVVTPHSKANPLSPDALVRRKCYPQCTFLCSLHYRVSQIG